MKFARLFWKSFVTTVADEIFRLVVAIPATALLALVVWPLWNYLFPGHPVTFLGTWAFLFLLQAVLNWPMNIRTPTKEHRKPPLS
jgi:hypothetical protein